MQCPHCAKGFHEDFESTILTKKVVALQKHCVIRYEICPDCSQYIIYCSFIEAEHSLVIPYVKTPISDANNTLIYPVNKKPRQLSKDDIPPEYIKDFQEADIALAYSPKASAALSRRLLQKLLEEKHAGIKPSKDFSYEIQQVIDSKQLPSYLANSIDYVRNIGNFGAHAIKRETTGQIVDVEPGEAELNLDVLEQLFDFYFVKPAADRRLHEELNKKLEDVGKPPMKTSES